MHFHNRYRYKLDDAVWDMPLVNSMEQFAISRLTFKFVITILICNMGAELHKGRCGCSRNTLPLVIFNLFLDSTNERISRQKLSRSRLAGLHALQLVLEL